MPLIVEVLSLRRLFSHRLLSGVLLFSSDNALLFKRLFLSFERVFSVKALFF